jgi:hypothetical protein
MQVPFAPVTVYVLLLVGLTDAVAVRTLPAFALQVYEDAPLAVSVELCPEQIAAGFAETVSVGAVVTVTITGMR